MRWSVSSNRLTVDVSGPELLFKLRESPFLSPFAEPKGGGTERLMRRCDEERQPGIAETAQVCVTFRLASGISRGTSSMLFRRRQRPGVLERMWVWLWPRRSWARSLRYVTHRIMRLKSSPHAVGLGCATGVFVSCTPLIGGQLALAGLLAYALRASVPAAMLATFFGNPLSWPLIWAATYAAGAQMIGDGAATGDADISARVDMLWHALAGQSPEMVAAAAAFVWPLFKPMLAGSLPIGLAAGLLIYYIMRSLARSVQKRRARSKPEAVNPAPVEFEHSDLAQIHA